MTNNKKYFLKDGGDKYHSRNKKKIINFKKELLCKKIESSIKAIKQKKVNVLEIGCGDAQRLIYLKKKFPLVNFYGIDPSSDAIKKTKELNINLIKSTADKIPFKKEFFDIIVYGFCLYLVDDRDLFKIATEAERVSKKKSFIIIFDFYSKNLIYKKYKHKKGIFVRKMDYSKIFSWSPYYKIISLKIISTSKIQHENKKNDYLSLIYIKKEIKNNL
jgi:ubiquinone/menaquinone biosynthesis C-methylase UbiE